MLVVIALVFSKERPADLNRRGQEVRAAARALAENQARHGPAAPPRCSGPCVRTLSSDFALLHVASVVRAAAAELQTIARKVSRLFKADLWRLDVFLSESEPPHVNELTYPSFRPDDPRDLARLADGYRLVARRGSSAVHGRLPISLVPAACSEIMLNAVLPGSVRETVNSAFDPRVCEGSSVY